jgi:GNAT superfamily N-acetyltransferase
LRNEFPRDRRTELLSLIYPGFTSVQLETVLDGTGPGAAYADSIEAPASAVVFHRGEAGFYFIGDPHNRPFLEELPALAGSLLVRHVPGETVFECSGDSAEWTEALRRVFGRAAEESTQRVYLGSRAESESPDGAAAVIPNGVELEEIGVGLAARETPGTPGLPDALDSFISEWWCSPQEFLRSGGGFIARDHDAVVGQCLISGRSRGRRAIDIAVEEEYRYRGIASALASRTVNRILEAGDTPYWECMGTNAGSIRLAEKCGLQLAFTYQLLSVALTREACG